MQNAALEEDTVALREGLAYLRGPAKRHYRDEERSIFPRLPKVHARTIKLLVRQHRDFEQATIEIASLCRTRSFQQAHALLGELAEACADHSRIEEQDLWPSVAALDEPEQMAAHREMRRRRQRRAR